MQKKDLFCFRIMPQKLRLLTCSIRPISALFSKVYMEK